MWAVTVRLREDATSERLKSFGEFLRQWLHEELDAGIIIPDLDRQTLDDLSAGELPQPYYLHQKASISKLRKRLRDGPAVSPELSDEAQRYYVDQLLSHERLLKELEDCLEEMPEPGDRSIMILVTPCAIPVDKWEIHPPKEVEDRIARIRSEGPPDVVERLEILVIAGDDADGFRRRR